MSCIAVAPAGFATPFVYIAPPGFHLQNGLLQVAASITGIPAWATLPTLKPIIMQWAERFFKQFHAIALYECDEIQATKQLGHRQFSDEFFGQ
ncbi:hypothetical protein LOK82_13160 [Xylella fastidiosa subsp. multiplex]|uniref:Uncharacterized protein n=1 Tax=Xylella fastidiosa subsp. multiplex TaxID=644357 RepID=A0AAW6HY35_XYLFS|nr:hypothetical protein [Xylella fastidiosa subsp. multiplex]